MNFSELLNINPQKSAGGYHALFVPGELKVVLAFTFLQPMLH